jgi:xanthine dehydrogenase small subunit
VDYQPIDSCIQFVFQVDGAHVVTVEGLDRDGVLHPVQQAMVDCHGSQCGYCTPGIVMALAGWREAGSDPRCARIALTGNLCRCTGYVPILEAADRLSAAPNGVRDDWHSPALAHQLRSLATESLSIEWSGRRFDAPTSLADAIAIKQHRPDTVIIAGATELAVGRNKRGVEPRALLSLRRIRELDGVAVSDASFNIGANATWAEIGAEVVPSLPAFRRIVERFGSPQIRQAATMAGNIANGSPIADGLPLLCVLDAELELVGPQGSRRRSINGFYTGYKQANIRPHEILARVVLPQPRPDDRLRLYKSSRRTDLDIATVGAAIRIRTEAEQIVAAAVCLSGVAPTVVRLPETETYLVGRPFVEATFRAAGRVARAEVRPISDVRGSSDFRSQLCENVLCKFFLDEQAACSEVCG